MFSCDNISIKETNETAKREENELPPLFIGTKDAHTLSTHHGSRKSVSTFFYDQSTWPAIKRTLSIVFNDFNDHGSCKIFMCVCHELNVYFVIHKFPNKIHDYCSC